MPIRCKIAGCNTRFTDAMAFMVHKKCDNPNCKCPEVQKIIQMTNTAIDKARRPNVIKMAKVGCTNDTQDLSESKANVYWEFPDIIVGKIEVDHQRNRGGKRRGK